MQTSLSVSKPTLYFCASLFILQAVYGFSAARSGGSPAIVDPWRALALYWAFGWWFISDSRTHGINWYDHYMDMGMILYIAWVFLLPYYLFKSRGWKAVLTAGLFLGVYFGAYIAGVILYSLVYIFT